MDFIINLLVSAGVLVLLSYMMPKIHIKSFWTALWVAFLIGLLNATIGILLRFPLNLVTLFFLQFLVRLIVTAVIIKIVDALVGNFKVDGFTTALIIAVALAVASSLVEYATADEATYVEGGSYTYVMPSDQAKLLS